MATNRMNVLLIGDPHFKVNNVRETNEMSEKIITLVKKRKPSFVICLGDVLDRHESIHVSPLERATQFLSALSELCPLYVIIGNHDRPNNSNFMTTEHPFNSLKKWKQTTIIDKITLVSIDNRKFIFVPYVPPGRFFEALADLFGIRDDYIQMKTSLNNNLNYRERHQELVIQLFSQHLQGIQAIFSHQEYYRAKMGAIESLVGDDWPLSFPHVYSGHIHDYDELQPNLTYVGTPIQHAFGDREDKTVSWLTFTDTMTHHRIDLQLPKKILIHLNYSEIEKYNLTVSPKTSSIKIVILGTSSEIKVAMKLAKIKNWISQGVKVSSKETNPNQSDIQHTSQQEQRTLTYSQRLFTAVEKDEALRKIYFRLYGDHRFKSGHPSLKDYSLQNTLHDTPLNISNNKSHNITRNTKKSIKLVLVDN